LVVVVVGMVVVVVGIVVVVVVEVVEVDVMLAVVDGAATGEHPATRTRSAASPRRMEATLTRVWRKTSRPRERHPGRFARH
jgi:hypothetical protein